MSVDFAQAAWDLKELSQDLKDRPTNGVTNVYPWPVVALEGSDPVLNVFEISAAAIDFAKLIRIQVPPGATVLINVSGEDVEISDMGMELAGAAPTRVLWNLHEATDLLLTGIQMNGSVLAPKAKTTFANGHMDGTMVAFSLQGNGEFGDAPFNGDLGDNGCAPAGGDCSSEDACDDGNPCTNDICQDKQCFHTPNDLATCSDGDACTKDDYCFNKMCVPGAPTDCDDGNQCTNDACDSITGQCKITPANGVKCDDGDKCTAGDSCWDKKCISGPPLDCDDDDPCTEDTCNQNEGCWYDAAVGTPCDDGDPCTTDESCWDWDCKGGTPSDCDDDNPCTIDACTPQGGCKYTNDDGKGCSDGDDCTVGDSCWDGQCTAGSPRDCSDGNVCTDDVCDPGTGCKNPADNGAACDDGDGCTGPDTCWDKKCVPGPDEDCDDGNVCTSDLCDPVQGCLHSAANGVACDDDDDCTVGDSCWDKKCVPGAPLDCDDGNVCTADSCDDDECEHAANNGVPCDDGDECTVNTTCWDKKCTGGSPLPCDDGNTCTSDSCDPASGCAFENDDGAPCDDGNECTTPDTCWDGKCSGQAPAQCDDGNPCTTDTCDPLQGCVNKAANGIGCDDGNACTEPDTCWDKKCVAGGLVDCDDGDVCTTDGCDPQTGCKHGANNGAKCSDGDDCTANDTCWDKQCTPGAPVDCDDGNVCTTDSCDPASGCQHSHANGIGCDDGDACTDPDTCWDGACSGKIISCDDGNVCTHDSCDPEQGCQHTAANGAPCSDGDVCTDGDTCWDENCVPGEPLDCDDGNICSSDTCDSEQGCLYQPANNGTPCDDGNLCTGACGPNDVVKRWTVSNAAPSTHGFWLPQFEDSSTTRWTPQTVVLDELGDGRVHMHGVAKVTSGPNIGQQWEVDIKWTFRGVGPAGEGSGGPKGKVPPVTDSWRYYDMVEPGRATRVDDPSEYATFTQRPTDSVFPMQLGDEANLKNDDFGMATWLDFRHYKGKTLHTAYRGDINVTLDEIPAPPCGDQCWDGQCVGTPPDCDDGNLCTVAGVCDPTTGQCPNQAPVETECGPSKLTSLTLQYTGGSCADSNNTQTTDTCTGDANDTDPALVKVKDQQGNLLFEGLVPLGGLVHVTPASGATLKANVLLWIKTPSGGWLQDVRIHTSCSEPVIVGEVFGGVTIAALTTEDGAGQGPPTIDCDDGDDCTIDSCDPALGCQHAPDPCCGPETECVDGQLVEITFRYTGEECSASNHQQGSKASCGNCCVNGMDPAMVVVKEGSTTVFNENVPLNGTFTVTPKGATFSDELQAWIKKVGGGAEQDLKIHTSCSKPFEVGDQFGALLVTGLKTQDGPAGCN